MPRPRELSALRKRLRRNGQPGEVDGDVPHLTPGRAFVHGATRRFIVEIDIGEFCPVCIGDDETLRVRGPFIPPGDAAACLP